MKRTRLIFLGFSFVRLAVDDDATGVGENVSVRSGCQVCFSIGRLKCRGKFTGGDADGTC